MAIQESGVTNAEQIIMDFVRKYVSSARKIIIQKRVDVKLAENLMMVSAS